MRNADDVGRAYVNLSDSLWMSASPRRRCDVSRKGSAPRCDLGVESVYGFYLRMNGVFFAWELGEWTTAGRLYREAMARSLDGGGAERYRSRTPSTGWSPSAPRRPRPSWARAWELIGTDPSATTTGPPPHLAGIELRLWQGRPVEAWRSRRTASVGWASEPSPLRLLVLRMAARAAAERP